MKNDVELTKRRLDDPSFMDRIDLVRKEMETTGKSLEDADNAVLARAIKMAQSGGVESNQPKQVQPTATQEPASQPVKTADIGKQALDMVKNDPEMGKIMKEVAGKEL